jgi:uncharacterized protein with PIN domain
MTGQGPNGAGHLRRAGDPDGRTGTPSLQQADRGRSEAAVVGAVLRGGRELDLFVHRAAIEIVPSDAGQAELARVAWREYGKGRHAAGLNFGDCFAYALARASGEPLLFKGDDFTRTDIQAADPGPAG